jgi:uncharacterized protein (TIGR02246 family)
MGAEGGGEGRSALPLAAVFLAVAALAALPVLARAPGEVPSADIAAIRRVNADLDRAWNRRGAAALAALFLEDADYQWPTGELLAGRSRIEEHFGTVVFRQMPADFRHVTETRRLRFLGPDIVIGDGTSMVTREGASEGKSRFSKFSSPAWAAGGTGSGGSPPCA